MFKRGAVLTAIVAVIVGLSYLPAATALLTCMEDRFGTRFPVGGAGRPLCLMDGTIERAFAWRLADRYISLVMQMF